MFFADWLVYSGITLVFKFQAVWTTSLLKLNLEREFYLSYNNPDIPIKVSNNLFDKLVQPFVNL
jgi:hypothetical protein